MRTIARSALAGGLAVLVVAGPAMAEIIALKADLSAENEVPPANSRAAGSAEIRFDTDTRLIEWTIAHSGLSAGTTAAHFHGPAMPGENAGPIVTIAGSLASPIAGSTTLTEAEAGEMLSGLWYINIHTAAFPGGEIRGQVVPAD